MHAKGKKKVDRIERKGGVRGVAHLMDICLVGPGARSSNHGSKGAESEDGFVCVGNVMLNLISQDSLS